MPGDEDQFQPGGMYEVSARLASKSGAPRTVSVGLHYGGGVVIAKTQTVVGQTVTVSGIVRLPTAASQAMLHVDCQGGICVVSSLSLKLLPGRQRVLEKWLYDGVVGQGQRFQYRYDEAAVNDSLHSAAAGSSNPYIRPTSENRGQAMAQESGPGGRARTTFYYQDDARKGQVGLEMLRSERMYDDFESGIRTSIWTKGDTPATSAAWRGDLAYQQAEDGSWRAASRAAEMQSGEAALLQFAVSGNPAQSLLAVERGSWGNANYRRLGAMDKTDGAGAVYLDALRDIGTNQVYTNLYPAGVFKRDAWYVLLLVVDGNGGQVQVWERDNPAQGRSYWVDMQSASSDRYRYVMSARNGVLWVDEYSEGRVYQVQESHLQWSAQGLGTLPSNALGSYTGLAVNWVYPVEQRWLEFAGGSGYAARRASYQYGSYGNPWRKLEASWDGVVGAWRDYRLEQSGFMPYTSADKYLVGLPAYVSRYTCPAGLLNGACSANYPSWLPGSAVRSSQWFLYDGVGVWWQTLQNGVLTGQRSLQRFQNAAQFSDPLYADERYEYDAYGNVTVWKSYRQVNLSADYGQGEYSQRALHTMRSTTPTW